MTKKIVLLITAITFSVGMGSCGNSKQNKTEAEANLQGSSANDANSDYSKTTEPEVKKIPVYMWECRHCGQRVKGIKEPSTMYCPADTYHSWTKVSETGYTTADATHVYLWECKYCGEQLEGTSMPNTNHCPAGTYHMWIKKSQVE